MSEEIIHPNDPRYEDDEDEPAGILGFLHRLYQGIIDWF